MNWISIAKKLTIDVDHIYDVTNYIGSNYYDIALIHVINRVAPVVELTGYVSVSNKAPVIAGWTGTRADTTYRVEQYINRHYRFDPIWANLPRESEVNSRFYTVIDKTAAANEDYRAVFFEKPKFGKELVFVIKEKEGWNVLKFYLEENEVDANLLQQLGELAAVLYPACKRHALNTDFSTTLETRPRTLDRLLLLLENRFPQLADRERQVCALTILGNKTQQIAEELDLSINTVVTYRRRAYDKLAVSNAYALVSELI